MALANAPWAADSGPLLQADSLKISVDVAGLLRGAVRITGFEAVNPVIRLQRTADGRENWRLGVEGVAPSGQGAGAGNALALSLDRAVITGGAMRFEDARAGTRLAYDDVDFLMLWPDAAGAAQWRLSAAPYGQPLVLEGQVARFADWIAGQAVPLEAKFSAAGARIEYDGTGDLNGFFNGRLAVDVPDSRALLAGLGQPGATVPQGLGQRVTGQAQLSLGQGRVLALDDMQLGLDGQVLQGALKLALGQTPRLTGALGAGQLDLSGLMGAGDTGAGALGGAMGQARYPGGSGRRGSRHLSGRDRGRQRNRAPKGPRQAGRGAGCATKRGPRPERGGQGQGRARAAERLGAAVKALNPQPSTRQSPGANRPAPARAGRAIWGGTNCQQGGVSPPSTNA